MATKDDKQQKRIKFITPTGVAIWPKLVEPDTKFDAEGTFSVRLRLGADDAAELMQLMDEMADEAYADAKAKLSEKPSDPKKIAAQKKQLEKLTRNDAYTMDVDDNGDETGDVVFNFKMSHVIKLKDGTTKRVWPKLFDAAGNPIKGKPQIFSGSELRVACQLSGYFVPGTSAAGVSARLNAVQVIKLVSGGDASSFGFAKTDGYIAPDSNGDDDDGSFPSRGMSEGEGGSEDSGSHDDEDF